MILLVVAVAGGSALSLRSAVVLSRDMITGDGSIAQLRPGPRYAVLRIPDNPATERYEADNRIAADFAQIYFSAQESAPSITAYTDDTPDPWQRQSRYPPLLFWICSVTFCTLPYGYASLVHVAIQYAVFVLSFVYTFRALRLERHFALSLLGVNLGLFLTPVGMSWFERGQFSLYIAAAYLWLLLGIYRSKGAFLVLAAALAYLKWTSFPTVFVVLDVWLLTSPDKTEFRRRVRLALVPVATIVSLFLLFPESGLYFLEGIARQESALPPEGLSLARVIPRWLVKALPLCLVVIGALQARRRQLEFPQLLPFVLASAIIILLYPTLAFDYSVPCLFGLIPFVLDWARRTAARGSGSWFVPTLFFLFLTAASTVKIVDGIAAANVDVAIICGYLACSAALLMAPVDRSRATLVERT